MSLFWVFIPESQQFAGAGANKFDLVHFWCFCFVPLWYWVKLKHSLADGSLGNLVE
jgi:hypothetical protein